MVAAASIGGVRPCRRAADGRSDELAGAPRHVLGDPTVTSPIAWAMAATSTPRGVRCAPSGPGAGDHARDRSGRGSRFAVARPGVAGRAGARGGRSSNGGARARERAPGGRSAGRNWPRCGPRAPASSRRPMPSGDVSSAICTTERNSGSSRFPWRSGSRQRAGMPTARMCWRERVTRSTRRSPSCANSRAAFTRPCCVRRDC